MSALLLLTSCTNIQSPAPNPDTEEQTPSGEQTTPPVHAGIDALCTEMKNASLKVGVAYLGFYEYGSVQDALTVFKDNNTDLETEYSILGSLTPQSIIGESMGEGYLILPADKDADVAVNRLNENGDVFEILYKGTPDTALLVFTNAGALVPDTQVVIVDSEGNVVDFVLNLNDMNRFDTPDGVLDFSDYSGQLSADYAYRRENDCMLVTKSELVNTSWSAERYLQDGTKMQYHIDFFEDTANIYWSINEQENNSFTSSWSLESTDSISTLHLDLENLDGKRDFHVLLSRIDKLLFIYEDFVSDDTDRFYEPLYTMLSASLG